MDYQVAVEAGEKTACVQSIVRIHLVVNEMEREMPDTYLKAFLIKSPLNFFLLLCLTRITPFQSSHQYKNPP